MNCFIIFTSIVTLSSLLYKNQCHGITLTPVINTKSGPVQGSINTTVWNSVKFSSFRGIPYAKPPLRNLRFKPPVPSDPWTSTLDATKEVNACPQIDRYTDLYDGDEDCLILNVFTPETEFGENLQLKPVMVYIHGGSFVILSSKSYIYGPDYLVEEDIVLVTLNYRLGALGFMHMNHVEVLGNAGLKDQNLALQWVQDNIAFFGGDLKRVTIFGQSAGAASVDSHILSPKSKNLFQQSITQSGVVLSVLYTPPQVAVKTAHRLATSVGCEHFDQDKIVECMRNVPARTIVEKTEVLNIAPANMTLPFVITTDYHPDASPEDIFLDDCPVNLFSNGNFKKRPSMRGFVYNEFLDFFQNFYGLGNATADLLALSGGTSIFIREVSNKIIEAASKVISDLYFSSQTDLMHRLLSLYDPNPQYYYRVNYDTVYQLKQSLGVPSRETGHEDELGYLFYETIMGTPTNPADPYNIFRKGFVQLWANFAKHGNPTPPGDENNITTDVWQPSGIRNGIFEISDRSMMIDRFKPINPLSLSLEVFYLFFIPLISSCQSVMSPLHYLKLVPSIF